VTMRINECVQLIKTQSQVATANPMDYPIIHPQQPADYDPAAKQRPSSSSSSELDDSFFEPDLFTASKLDFEMMPHTPSPLKNRRIDDYVKISGNLSRSFHDIYKMKKAHSNPDKKPALYFFKQNKYEKSDQYMYELEASVCSFYHFLAPEFAPTARAVYDETNKYVGIAVKSLPGFKSTLEDPLKEEDLDIEALKHCSIQELEEIDERAKYENLDLDNTPDNQVIHIHIKRELGTSATQHQYYCKRFT
jgi:hypothetical protein